MSSQRHPVQLASSFEVREIRPGARVAPVIEQSPEAIRRYSGGQLELVDRKVVHVDFPLNNPLDDEPGLPETTAEYDADQTEQLESQALEVYGRSLRGIRAAGEAALKGAEVSTSPEIRRLKGEFDSAVGEMFKTAPGIGEHVTMERRERFDVQEGKVMAESSNGLEAVESIIERGIVCSQELSETSNPAMCLQVDRDKADLRLLTESVQPMFNETRPTDYNTVIAVSAFPEDGVEQNGTQFWKELGYNTEFRCAMLQMYHRTPDGQLQTRTLSIDSSSMPRLVEALTRHGAKIPPDCSVGDVLTCPITDMLNYDQACRFMDDFVQGYEADAGLEPKLATTEQLMEQHATLRNRTFNDLYLEVARSLADNYKTTKVKDFLYAINIGLNDMDEHYRSKLQEITARDTFNEEAARLIHGVVLYSVAETVRSTVASSLKKRFYGKDKPLTLDALYSSVHLQENYHNFMDQMGRNFIGGVKLGISYGGCGALFEFGNPLALQQAFGGLEKKLSREEEGDAGDGLGPIEFKCTNNHHCRRPYGGKLKKCLRCNDNGESVGC